MPRIGHPILSYYFFSLEWNEIKNWHATTATLDCASVAPRMGEGGGPIINRVRLVCDSSRADEPALAVLIRTDNALFIRHTWCTLVY